MLELTVKGEALRIPKCCVHSTSVQRSDQGWGVASGKVLRQGRVGYVVTPEMSTAACGPEIYEGVSRSWARSRWALSHVGRRPLGAPPWWGERGR